MKKYFLFLILLSIFTGCFKTDKSKITMPYFEDFKNTNNYSLDAGAKFDPNISASKGSGSVKFTKTGNSWVMSDRIISDIRIPVTPGSTYTLSFKSITSAWPPPSLEVYGSMGGDNGAIENSDGTMCANSQKDTWEENFISIKIPKNDSIKFFQIKILMLPKKGINAPIWIDDIKFQKGIHFETKDIQKKSFSGKITKVDNLGNIEIKENGKFKPFFPIGIYTDENRKDWSIYKKLGFNTNMWAASAQAIKKAKEAGLYSAMQIVQYIVPEDEDWIPQDPKKKIAHLHKTLQEIKDKGLWSDLLFYYVDNEFYHLNDNFTHIIDLIHKQDNNSHPIYMLSGAYGMARKYNNYIDFTGTYVAQDGFETPIIEAFELLDNTPNQKQPVVFAQINRGVGKNFRAIFYAALAKGAKGVGFWRDGGSAGKIDSRPIAKQLPIIAKEVKNLLPVIRTDHKNNLKLLCDNEKIIFGTRIFKNKGYIIISNPSGNTQKGTFTLKNIFYKANNIRDYFSNKIITKVDNNKFAITLDKYEATVLELD